MRNIILIAILCLCPKIGANAGTPDLVGAWRGPKDLMVNLCEDKENGFGVCYCGIFRTFGWVDVESKLYGDSLSLHAKDYGSPLEGRFRVESPDTITGHLTMGTPGEDWYFNGSAKLVRQKPVVPDNLNPSLEGEVRQPDCEVLPLCRDITREVLSTVSPESYGYGEKAMVEKLLDAKIYPITPKELVGFRRVRSIQIDGRYGIFSYPYFKCRFRESGGKVFFEKTTGSQRKSGYVYQNSPTSLVFLGGWSVNNEPQTPYGSANSIAGMVYKIGAAKAIMIFPTTENRAEIYELIK